MSRRDQCHHETDEERRARAAAAELLAAVGDAAWDHSALFFEAVLWLASAAEAAGYDTSAVSRSCIRGPRALPSQRTPTEDGTSIVYYVQRADACIKIGYSAGWRQRLSAISREHGVLTFLAAEPGGHALETRRHDEFAAHRIGNTEWFRPGATLIRHVVGLAASGKLPIVSGARAGI